MKATNRRDRKCSALLAAGAGAAVCLTGGASHAAFVMGNISASNSGRNTFNIGNLLHAFGNQAYWLLYSTPGGRMSLSWVFTSARLNRTGAFIAMHNAGVTISAGMANGFSDRLDVPSNVSNKFIAVEFQSAGTRYGWLHVISTNATGSQIVLDKWGYENAGGTCKTLSDSVTTRKLGLTDGRIALHWTNANENGVARYEIQAKNAAGEWKAVDSAVPGEGRYVAQVANGAEWRLVVEKVDGTSEDFDF